MPRARIKSFPDYEIDDAGNVYTFRSGKKGMKLKPFVKNGYKAYRIWGSNGERVEYLHRLLLMTFVGPCPVGWHCRHLNGKKLDNRLENLSWGTKAENVLDAVKHGSYARGERHGMAKLTASQVVMIRELAKLKSEHEIAKMFGITYTNVHKIKTRESWSWLK